MLLKLMMKIRILAFFAAASTLMQAQSKDLNLNLNQPVVIRKGSILCDSTGNLELWDYSAPSQRDSFLTLGYCSLSPRVLSVKVVLSSEQASRVNQHAVIQAVIQMPTLEAVEAEEPRRVWVHVSDLSN